MYINAKFEESGAESKKFLVVVFFPTAGSKKEGKEGLLHG